MFDPDLGLFSDVQTLESQELQTAQQCTCTERGLPYLRNKQK